MKYSVDTSSLIESWYRRYPIDIFPSFWHKMSDVIQKKIIVAQQLVIEEIEQKDDDLHQWIKNHNALQVPFDEEVQKIVGKLLEGYPRLVGRHQAFGADVFVIGLAKQHDLTVITEEQAGSATKPKIPFVCGLEKIPCITMVEFIREIRWTF